MKHTRIASFLATGLLFAACGESLLEEEVYSELGPSNFFQTEADASALVSSVYSIEQDYGGRNAFLLGEIPTDIMWDRQGGLERLARPLEDFTWDATHEFFQGQWSDAYRAIYRANLAIDRIPEMKFDEQRKKVLVAEARFLRAESYMHLYDYFGPTPLITSSEVDARGQPARATAEEMQKFVESELRAAAADLPVKATQYGRATRGAALAFLARFHLNNHKWEPAAATAKEVMDLGAYSLFQGKQRGDLFLIENERNSEFIHVRPYVTNLRGNAYLAHAAPPGYKFKAPPKTNFSTQYMLYSSFSDSFHPQDQRKGVILTQYENEKGQIIQLGKDNARSFKYQEDPAAVGTGNGNDVPAIRYADILLIRAEALNELQGPNAESLELINRVRAAAGVPAIAPADVPSKQALRDHILKERGWEFFTEALRRQDLIRHGKLVESALQRGKNAKPHHVLYPLPQSEMDKNPNLKQNPGY